jgi:hypothetical protein
MKKFLILLSSILFLFVLIVTSCKKENKRDDFVGSTWVSHDDDFVVSTPMTLTFTSENALTININEDMWTGTYTKHKSIVNMTIYPNGGEMSWTGTIYGETMIVSLNGTSHSLTFVRQ